MRSGRNVIHPLRLLGAELSPPPLPLFCSAPSCPLFRDVTGSCSAPCLSSCSYHFSPHQEPGSTSPLPSSHPQKGLDVSRVYTTLSLQGVYILNGIAETKG